MATPTNKELVIAWLKLGGKIVVTTAYPRKGVLIQLVDGPIASVYLTNIEWFKVDNERESLMGSLAW